MENLSLTPSQESPILFMEGDGGSYYVWNNTNFPFLGAAEVSAATLILKPGGFALPHYADCNKIGYVIQGSEGVTGIINPSISAEEKVVKLKKGDAIVVAGGAISWWFNAGTEDLKFVFLGESNKDLGQLIYRIFTGPVGLLTGFPTSTMRRAFDMNEEQANVLVNSQKDALILKLENTKTLANSPKVADTKALCYNFDEKSGEIRVENGGFFSSLTYEKHLPLVGIKLSGNFLKLEPKAMFGPVYYERDSGDQLVYVVNGSGWVQVLAMTGKIVLDVPLKSGQVFAVPKLYLVAIGAGDAGIECFSIVNTSKPILGEIAGKTSVWNALSPEVLQVSLNISPEFCDEFLEKLKKTSIISPSQ